MSKTHTGVLQLWVLVPTPSSTASRNGKYSRTARCHLQADAGARSWLF